MHWKDQAERAMAGSPISEGAGIFGADVPADEAALVLLTVPWDGTASYGKGTACGPASIIAASHQLDYFDLDYGAPVLAGIASAAVGPIPFCQFPTTIQTNLIGESINEKVFSTSRRHLENNKIVGVIGGEHSVPYGLLKALAQRHKSFGILHIDAHHDLRNAYEGYKHSHASIMYNVLEDFAAVDHLTCVGIRDFSREEHQYAAARPERIRSFYDQHLQEQKATGRPWKEIIAEIVRGLPDNVYLSFDIDGLDPSFCPGTGTPVPGGLSYAEATLLMKELFLQKKNIIGFDLCEVSPAAGSDWDANVGARLLYKMCGLALASGQDGVKA